MSHRIDLYHALARITERDPSGAVPEFSMKAMVTTRGRKGAIIFIKRGEANFISREKARAIFDKGKLAHAPAKKTPYNHRDFGVIAIRVIESPDMPPGVVTLKKLAILEINGMKTAL